MAEKRRDDIARAREIRGFTQEQLAQLADVSTRTVARLEAGENLQPKQLRKLAQALGVPIGFLVGGEAAGPPPKLTWPDFRDRIRAALGEQDLTRDVEERMRFAYEAYIRQGQTEI